MATWIAVKATLVGSVPAAQGACEVRLEARDKVAPIVSAFCLAQLPADRRSVETRGLSSDHGDGIVVVFGPIGDELVDNEIPRSDEWHPDAVQVDD